MTRALALILCLLGGRLATPEEVDRARLISLLEFPTDEAFVAFRFTMTGVTLWGSEKDSEQFATNQIKALEEKLVTNPNDPDLHLQLGALYAQNSQEDLSDRTFRKALDLYQARVRPGQKNNPELVVGMASTLESLNRQDDAANLIRGELKRSPKEARYWAALGNNLSSQIVMTLTGTNLGSISDPNIIYSEALKRKLHGNQLSAAIKSSFKEASECFDQAISYKPKDAGLYRQRMIFRYLSGMALQLAESDKSQLAYQTAFKDSMRSVSADLRKIADLSPHDSDAIGASMLGEWIIGAFDAGSKDLCCDNFDQLPEQTKANIRKRIKQLEALVKENKIPNKATALCSIGFFEFMLGKKTEGQAALRQAIDLNQSVELGWELLLATFAIDKQWPEISKLCREKSRYRDSARNHYIAAKAAEHLKEPDQSRAEIMKALELDAKHFNANIAFAVLLLRENSKRGVEKAGLILDELGKRPDLTQTQWRNLMIPGGVALALAGDKNSAKEWFNTLLQNYPDDEDAKAALAAFTN